MKKRKIELRPGTNDIAGEQSGLNQFVMSFRAQEGHRVNNLEFWGTSIF
jgi:hypothetical protein